MSTPVRTVYIELRASAEALRKDMAAGKSEVLGLGAAGKEAGNQMSAGIDKASVSVRKVVEVAAEGAALLTGAHTALTAVVAKYGATVATSGSATEGLANTYRGLRIALSPTPFTVATIAVGILTEETIRLTYARAKLIEQQSLIAAVSGRSIGSIEGIGAAAGISGGNAAALRGLGGVLADRGQSGALNALGLSVNDPDLLAKIARVFDSVADPAERAAIAVRLFGAEHAEVALRELNLSFASGADAVKRYGLVLDSVSRTQIFQFREDMRHLGGSLDDVKSNFSGAWQAGEQFAEVMGAAVYDGVKRAFGALDDLIARLTHLRGALAPLQTLPSSASLGRPIDSNGVAADNLFALAQGSAARKSQTLEGRRSAQGDAQSAADSAYSKLAEDQAKRQENPNDPSLLTGDQRFLLANQQQSKAALAAAIGTEVKTLEDEEKAEKDAASAATARVDVAVAAVERLKQAKLAAGEASIDTVKRNSAAEDASLTSSQARAIGAAQDEVDATEERLAQVNTYEEEAAQKHIALLRQKFGDDRAENIRLQGEIDAVRDEATGKENAAMAAREAARQNLTTVIAQATREDAKNDEMFREEISRTNTEWAKRGFEGRTQKEATVDISAAAQLRGKPVGSAVAADKAGYKTLDEQQSSIASEQALLAYIDKGGYSLGQQLQLREKILQSQIALLDSQGKSSSQQQIQLASLQLQQTFRQWNQPLGGKFAQDGAQAFGQVPGALGGALAQGLLGGGKHESVGKEVGDAMKQIGVHLLGQIMTQMIEKLIATTIGQFALNILNMWAIHATPNPFGLFAAGGSTPTNKPYWVGEKGPELRFDSRPGYVMSNHDSAQYASSAVAASSAPRHVGSSFSSSGHTFHIYESSDPRETARSVGEYLKTTWPGGSPYNGG